MRVNVLKEALKEAGEHYRAGRLKEALVLYRRVLDGDPEQTEALNGLARLSLDMGQGLSAATLVLRSLARDPESAPAMRLLDEALGRIEGQEERAQVLFEYSEILKSRKLSEAALVEYRRALYLNPALARHDDFESITLLADGNLEDGWTAFEWRNTIGSLGPFTDRVWSGEPLAGKTVLVWGEQGIGDQIMFSTCLPDLIDAAGHVVVAVDERLVPLFQRSFPDASVHGGGRFTPDGASGLEAADRLSGYPPPDYFIMQGSLPRFFRPTLESFPRRAHGLRPDRERVSFWRRQLRGLGTGPAVGIAWRSLRESGDRTYPEFDLWRPLLERRGISLVCLQAGVTPDETALLEERFGVRLRILQGLDPANDFDDTAALIAALDGVVTTMNSVQWLSAAVGVPVWSIARDNRRRHWPFLGEEHYPWFPEMHACLEEDDDLLRRAFATAARELQHP